MKHRIQARVMACSHCCKIIIVCTFLCSVLVLFYTATLCVYDLWKSCLVKYGSRVFCWEIYCQWHSFLSVVWPYNCVWLICSDITLGAPEFDRLVSSDDFSRTSLSGLSDFTWRILKTARRNFGKRRAYTTGFNAELRSTITNCMSRK